MKRVVLFALAGAALPTIYRMTELWGSYATHFNGTLTAPLPATANSFGAQFWDTLTAAVQHESVVAGAGAGVLAAWLI